MTLGASISAFAFRGARGRMIAERLTYAAGIAVLMLLLAAWIVSAETDPRPYTRDDVPWSVLGLADVFAVWLLGFGAFVLGPAVVAATVAGERRAGTLDQLRTTPLSPLQLASGLMVGAPARLYLLCAGPLAIHVAAGVFGVIPFDTLVATLVVLVAGGLASAVVGLCVALAPKQETGGAFVALGVAGLLGAAGLIASSMAMEPGATRWAFLHPAGALQSAMLQHDGLWRRLFISTWRLERFSDGSFGVWLSAVPALSVAVTLLGGTLLLRAACRRLMAPHRPLLSKKQAVALFGLGAAGIILPLPISGHGYHSEITVSAFATGAMLLPLAAVLSSLATPTFEAWALALRQNQKLRWWHDEAAPHYAFLFMAVLFLVTLKARVSGFPMRMNDGEMAGFVWALGLALTVPVFSLFASTRYSTGPARFGFGVAMSAHVLYQVISIGIFAGNNGLPRNSEARVAVEIGMLLAVAIPAWVLFRQKRLAERVRAGQQS
jgi:hypothetical protein